MSTTLFHHRHTYECASSGLCPTRRLREFRAHLADVVGDLAVLPEDLRSLLLDALQEVCDAFIEGLVLERWPDAGADLDDLDVTFVVEDLDELLGGFQESVVASALAKLDRLVERAAGK